MCSWRIGTLALWATLCGAAPASGQAPTVSALQHRADSLLALWREANSLARIQQESHAVKSTAVSATTRATAAARGMRPVQVQGLMILSDAPEAIPLQAAAARTWAALDRTYGKSAPALTTQPLRIHVIRHDRASPSMANARAVADDVSTDVLTRTLLALVGPPRLDAGLAAWLGGDVRPLLDTAATSRANYIDLVLAPSRAARRCFAGDLAGCGAALELADDTTFFLTVYDAADRRAAVADARSPDILDPLDRAIFDRCTVNQIDSACVDFLRNMGRSQIPRPLPDQTREFLVSTVLDLGGPAAYDRLVAEPAASIPSRLRVAAALPLDSLLATWRARIIAARPPAPSVPLADGLLALLWIGVLATCALRSSRWRVA
jgi:hypothetical protein